MKIKVWYYNFWNDFSGDELLQRSFIRILQEDKYEFTLDKFFIDSKISGSYVLQDIDTSESTRYRKRAKHYGKLSYERRFINWDTNIYLKTSGSRDDGQKLSP